MVATLERLGVLASFSRPSVSNDNPFSESLFRTLKYRPECPTQPFADLAAAGVGARVCALVPTSHARPRVTSCMNARGPAAPNAGVATPAIGPRSRRSR
jgi:transposase InsO family protein